MLVALQPGKSTEMESLDPAARFSGGSVVMSSEFFAKRGSECVGVLSSSGVGLESTLAANSWCVLISWMKQLEVVEEFTNTRWGWLRS